MDNIIGGRSAVIQVTFLMEDRGFCKDVFATVEKPTRYYNRIFENYNYTWVMAGKLNVTAVSARKRSLRWSIKGGFVQETETVTLRERSPLSRFLSLNGEKRSAALKSCQI